MKGENKMNRTKNFKKVGLWWDNSSVELVEIEGKVYALHGWDGEKWGDCWECVGDDQMEKSKERYVIRPFYDDIE